MLDRKELATMIRYGLVGLSNTLVSALLMWTLSWTGLAYPVYSALAYGVGMIQSFVLNRFFTFRPTGGSEAFRAAKFLVVNLVCLGLAQGVQALLREVLVLPLPVALGGGMVVYTGAGYLLNRLWVFRLAAPTQPARSTNENS